MTSKIGHPGAKDPPTHCSQRWHSFQQRQLTETTTWHFSKIKIWDSEIVQWFTLKSIINSTICMFWYIDRDSDSNHFWEVEKKAHEKILQGKKIKQEVRIQAFSAFLDLFSWSGSSGLYFWIIVFRVNVCPSQATWSGNLVLYRGLNRRH